MQHRCRVSNVSNVSITTCSFIHYKNNGYLCPISVIPVNVVLIPHTHFVICCVLSSPEAMLFNLRVSQPLDHILL